MLYPVPVPALGRLHGLRWAYTATTATQSGPAPRRAEACLKISRHPVPLAAGETRRSAPTLSGQALGGAGTGSPSGSSLAVAGDARALECLVQRREDNPMRSTAA